MVQERNTHLAENVGLSEAVDVRLHKGVSSFINTHVEVQRNHGKEVSVETEQFLSRSLLGVVQERNARGLESNSEEVKEAIEIIRDVFSFPTFGVLCVDGRNKRLRMFGLVPGVLPSSGIGGFMHVPAGEVPDFKQSKQEGLILEADSYFGSLIERQVEKYGKIVEVRDAHRGCAAKNLEQNRIGSTHKDKGLYANVTRLIKEAKATEALVGAGNVVSIITSYDPQTDGLLMGLERKSALAAGVKDGYTPETLRELARTNEIIDTEILLKEQGFGEFLDDYQVTNFDWDNYYASTLVQFWRNIRQMKDDGLVHGMAQFVKKVYHKPGAPQNEWLDEQELQERALLLVTNAYSAHLFRRKYQHEQGITDLKQDPENPNAHHCERIFSITEVDDGPYPDFPDFSVFSQDLANLPDNVLLTFDIINTNIDNGMKDVTQTYASLEEIKGAPKIGIAKAVIRADLDWEKVRRIDWSDMPDTWVTMSPADFREYVREKCRLVRLQGSMDDFENFFKGLNHLREVMRELNSHSKTRKLIQEAGKLVVMPMLVTDSREVVSIPQFIEKGVQPS